MLGRCGEDVPVVLPEATLPVAVPGRADPGLDYILCQLAVPLKLKPAAYRGRRPFQYLDLAWSDEDSIFWLAIKVPLSLDTPIVLPRRFKTDLMVSCMATSRRQLLTARHRPTYQLRIWDWCRSIAQSLHLPPPGLWPRLGLQEWSSTLSYHVVRL